MSYNHRNFVAQITSIYIQGYNGSKYKDPKYGDLLTTEF